MVHSLIGQLSESDGKFITTEKGQQKPTKKTKTEESAGGWCKRTTQAKGYGKEIADMKDLIQGIHLESLSFRIAALTHVRSYISDNGARIKGCDPRQ